MSYSSAQSQYDAVEPKEKPAQDCESCNNTGEICKGCQGQVGGCFCTFFDISDTTIDCDNPECDWLGGEEA
jgi:hypothetical protein